MVTHDLSDMTIPDLTGSKSTPNLTICPKFGLVPVEPTPIYERIARPLKDTTIQSNYHCCVTESLADYYRNLNLHDIVDLWCCGSPMNNGPGMTLLETQ